MAARTIPTVEGWPTVGKLIRNIPELFTVSEIIGVFEGTDICSSFILNNTACKSIYFYENFSFTTNQSVIDEFTSMYAEWEEQVPNLKIQIKDGNEFEGHNFLWIDIPSDLSEFTIKHKEKIKSYTLAGTCGYGITLSATTNICKAIDLGLIFPVLLYRDYIFYTFNREFHEEAFTKIQQILDSQYIESLVHGIKYLRFKPSKDGFLSRVEKFK